MLMSFLLVPKIFTTHMINKNKYFIWRNLISEKLKNIDELSFEIYKNKKEEGILKKSLHKAYRLLLRNLNDLYFTILANFLRFCELSRVNSLFYPLYFTGLYYIIGPHFIGELVLFYDVRFHQLMYFHKNMLGLCFTDFCFLMENIFRWLIHGFNRFTSFYIHSRHVYFSFHFHAHRLICYIQRKITV